MTGFVLHKGVHCSRTEGDKKIAPTPSTKKQCAKRASKKKDGTKKDPQLRSMREVGPKTDGPELFCAHMRDPSHT